MMISDGSNHLLLGSDHSSGSIDLISSPSSSLSTSAQPNCCSYLPTTSAINWLIARKWWGPAGGKVQVLIYFFFFGSKLISSYMYLYQCLTHSLICLRWWWATVIYTVIIVYYNNYYLLLLYVFLIFVGWFMWDQSTVMNTTCLNWCLNECLKDLQ